MSTMRDYQTKGYSSRGARMGRGDDDLDLSQPLDLTEVYVDDGGYDEGGAYWGTGQPLWCASDCAGGAVYTRAASREGAMRKLEAEMPCAIMWASANPIEPAFLASYLDTAVEDWRSQEYEYMDGDEDGDGLSDYSTADISPGSLAKATVDCERLQRENTDDLGVAYSEGMTPSRAGYLFWHQRNGAGVGFSDGDINRETGKRLSFAVRRSGGVYLYMGDDGKLHFS